MSKYFEDFTVGAVSTSRTRTITEADIVNFAGLSGDFVELHMSETYAAAGPFGRRIAHGALIFSISTGLMIQMGEVTDTVIAFYGVDKLRFVKPVFIGDTIHVVKKVIATEAKGPGRGVITSETTVLNQNGEPVVVYTDKAMIKARQ
ncbi:MAG TPA: MaoC/PaaZ C-terminal domain-containing protein [Bryobacteraceae bacterium]|nr:MaoC/PaaZ C-terminal domain-containing protein [Bryobacteraceae bacterium]